jgi:hypothetical protein
MAQAGLGQLARQQVDRGHAGDQRDQGARPDALQPDRGDLLPRYGREQLLADRGQHVAPAAQRVPGGADQRDGLQQRQHPPDLVPADLVHRHLSGPLRSDVQCELDDQLGQVEAALQVASGHVTVARVE